MTRLLLDSNICIELIRGKNLAIVDSFREAAKRGDSLILSSIVEFELAYGVANSDRHRESENAAKLNQFLSYPFDRMPFYAEDGIEAGRIRAYLKSAGTPIGSYDLLIAGQAITHDLTVVTANVREFSRVPGLKWTSWSASG